ncbi:MAG: hypothetical protein K5842_04590 [Bacteroidales bacterium]|nr:hypothetical protein [Bacteroidales bacterium]
MKKLFIFAATILLAQTIAFAQNGKTVSEKDVPERYVKDFQRLATDVKNVEWRIIDTLVYDAKFVNESGTKTAYRFSPKGTETRWFIDEKYYPHTILDKIKELHPNYKVKELYALQIRNKVTYQVLAGQRKGLFTKKWKNMRLLNFETDYKFIDEIEL